VDVRDMTQHDLRALLGFVPQKALLFGGDIASNIKFSDPDGISDEDMREAAEIAQATEFINEKPEGYASPITQGGGNVSGGQRQRLSIARAIAKKPPVLVFDDSFSALDYKTDSALRKALAAKVGAGSDRPATVIIVAQRISTILAADQIIVLDEGKIAGIGTHRELLQNCPTYQEIARSQLSEAEIGKTSCRGTACRAPTSRAPTTTATTAHASDNGGAL
jgi:ATP-binding cassette subfamily B protein